MDGMVCHFQHHSCHIVGWLIEIQLDGDRIFGSNFSLSHEEYHDLIEKGRCTKDDK